jgi:hypothetical protein
MTDVDIDDLRSRIAPLDDIRPLLPESEQWSRHEAVRVIDPEPTVLPGAGLERSLVREVMGDEAFLLGCGAPILPSVGLVDAMRVSPDTFHEGGEDRAVGIVASGRHSARIQEVQLEVVDAEIADSREHIAQIHPHLGMRQVKPDQVVTPVFGSLADTVRAIRDSGRRAGIWLAPFSVGARSDLAQRHPGWLTGPAGYNWGDDLVGLDLTHPEVRMPARRPLSRIARTVSASDPNCGFGSVHWPVPRLQPSSICTTAGQRALEEFGDRFGVASGARVAASVPRVWCTWYRYFEDVRASDVVENLGRPCLNRRVGVDDDALALPLGSDRGHLARRVERAVNPRRRATAGLDHDQTFALQRLCRRLAKLEPDHLVPPRHPTPPSGGAVAAHDAVPSGKDPP